MGSRTRLAACIVALAGLSAGIPAHAADSLQAQLAARGHADTHICRGTFPDVGLGPTLYVQFEPQADEAQSLDKAIAILQLMAEALASSRQWYVGFQPAEKWSACQQDAPQLLFWRDFDDNWRYAKPTPVEYLDGLLGRLSDDQRGTSAEAYVLFAIGSLHMWSGRSRESVDNFSRAYEMLGASNDPNGIFPFVLLPLIHHELGRDDKGRDKEARVQTLLEQYARVADDADAGGEYEPLFKVAPDYPRRALRKRQQGYVLLEFTVDPAGRVVDPVIVEERPKGVFGKAALAAVLQFRYVPRIEAGQLVATERVRNRITFELPR